MPHLIVEHTRNIPGFEAYAALRAVNAALAASGHFEEADIKSRAHAVDTFEIGTASEARGFVAARLLILSGRPAEAKRQLSRLVLETLRAALPAEPALQLQVSVEIVDIERDSYAKAVLGDARSTAG